MSLEENEVAILQIIQDWWEETEETVDTNPSLSVRIERCKEKCPPHRLQDVEALVMAHVGDDDFITDTIDMWWKERPAVAAVEPEIVGKSDTDASAKYREICPPHRLKDLNSLIDSSKGDEQIILEALQNWWNEPPTAKPDLVDEDDDRKPPARTQVREKEPEQQSKTNPRQQKQQQRQQKQKQPRQSSNVAQQRVAGYDFFRGYTANQRERMTENDMYDALYRPHEAEAMQKGAMPITHIGQVYDWHPELVTKQEDQVEEFYRNHWKLGTPALWWKDLIDSGDRSIPWRGSVIRWKNGMKLWKNSMRHTPLNGRNETISNEMYMKEKLVKRRPALGLNESQLNALEREVRQGKQSSLEETAMFHFIRNTMLAQLISCDGASTMKDLIRILRDQLATGRPAPIPKWFTCSDGAFLGTGYNVCENRGCYRTDTAKKQLLVCSKCKLVVYCSNECMMADRHARHKVCCKEARRLNDLNIRQHSSNVD